MTPVKNPPKKNRIVLSLSGGMDSTTMMAVALARGFVPLPVLFRYGSKHSRLELEAARRVADYYAAPLAVVDLESAFTRFRSNLLSTGGPIPEGHYQAKSMAQTVVPARNMIFASYLAGYAWTWEARQVWLGIHQGDHAIYPDCRPEFYVAMRKAVEYGTDGQVDLCAPFLTTDKEGILREGLPLKVPYHATRTCYASDEIACGRCGACQERLAAFKAVGKDDPLEYQSREILPKEEVSA